VVTRETRPIPADKLADTERLLRVAPEPDAPLLKGEESDWIAAAQSGDRAAFAQLVSVYWDRLYHWLFHLTHDRHRAEDLTQETFLKALSGVKSFRSGSNFRAWLFRIGHNNFVNLKRSEKRSDRTATEELDGFPDSIIGPAETVMDREGVELVAKAVRELPTDFRTALLLRAEQGMSFREVAAILKITEETARWRVFKARQKLMKVLSVPGEESETLDGDSAPD
jgi:RNA polymerase sigma-70 factor, ECF subfamily